MLKNIFFSFIILFTLSLTLEAKSIEAKFDVSYGILGKIGTANALLEKEKNSYKINIDLVATGLAKYVSRGRKEQHISTGHMEQGLMVSDVYQVIKSYGNTKMQKEYHIDHTKKQVRKIYKKFKKGKLVAKEDTILDFYSKDDLLTLYFNLDRAIADKRSAKTYTFKAIGAENQKGKVTVIIPKEKQRHKYIEVLGKDVAWYATAIIHQKIFSSKEGRLMLGVDEDGITNQAVLKDVIFFGDIRAKRVD